MKSALTNFISVHAILSSDVLSSDTLRAAEQSSAMHKVLCSKLTWAPPSRKISGILLVVTVCNAAEK